jgi:hypothetical protein
VVVVVVVLAEVDLMEHQVEQVAAMDQVQPVALVDPASTGIQGKVVHNQLAVRAALILIEGMDQARQDQLRKGGMVVMILQDLEQVEQVEYPEAEMVVVLMLMDLVAAVVVAILEGVVALLTFGDQVVVVDQGI